ncbi:MAG: MoaD/ThiS family protein [Desulfobacterales bacterium]|nr:MoaD/ThiS family protein [Desulfobacterales bacterium]
MTTIFLNAFSFLQPKLKARNIEYADASIEIPDDITARQLITDVLGLEPEDVEAVMINGKVSAATTSLNHKDRIGLIPPGMPGPYRVFLGIVKHKFS